MVRCDRRMRQHPAPLQVVFGQRVTRLSKTGLAPVAQGIEHSFPKAGVAGSIPAGGAFFYRVLWGLGLLAQAPFYMFWAEFGPDL